MQALSGQELNAALLAALRETDAYMSGTSKVQLSAAALAGRLDTLEIDYAIVGALALAAHGFVRLTVDVDVLITREGLARFKADWLGRGYVEIFPGSKGVRDTEHDVKVDFLLTGEFPGDGKPKPVSFPDPKQARVRGEPFAVASLETILELKLASGMSAPHRGQDLVDVQRLIRARAIPRAFAEQLDPHVRSKFEELWQLAQHPDEDF